jgi:hypothetical protein
MALPIIPIIMAVASIGSGIVQGISQAKDVKAQANAINKQAEEQIAERARQAKKLMQQQKTSFLKGGVYFDSGSPLSVIDETYDFMKKDVNAMAKDANTKSKNLVRQGKTAFFNSILQGVANGAMAYFLGGGSAGSMTKIGNTIKGSKIGGAVRTWWNNRRGWLRGGFDDLPASSSSGIA